MDSYNRSFANLGCSEIAPPGPRRVVCPNPKGVWPEKTMKQEYFVVVLAHSLRGRLRRIHVPHTAVYAILALALLGCFSVIGDRKSVV